MEKTVLLETVQKKIGYKFRKPALLLTALTHRSYVNEHPQEEAEDNERLEFLGDAVLDLLVSEYLFEKSSSTREGDLSFFRSRVVETSSCRLFLEKLSLGDSLLLGKGEKMNQGKARETLQANLFEAFLGALYLDSGWEKTKEFFFSHLGEAVDSILSSPERNWKAELQERIQRDFKESPVYQVLEERGPDHSKEFLVAVVVKGKIWGKAWGGNKKEAQQHAAKEALEINGSN